MTDSPQSEEEDLFAEDNQSPASDEEAEAEAESSDQNEAPAEDASSAVPDGDIQMVIQISSDSNSSTSTIVAEDPSASPAAVSESATDSAESTENDTAPSTSTASTETSSATEESSSTEENNSREDIEQSSAKKRKAEDPSSPVAAKKKATSPLKSDNDDDDEGAVCTICFEPWTNSGNHRISSLKCGHFFGFACIDRWIRGNGSACPNCNEKATRRDIRLHYVARLKAIDTSEKDRAIGDLEKVNVKYRQLDLEHKTLKVAYKLLQDDLKKSQQRLRDLNPSLGLSQSVNHPTAPSLSSEGSTYSRLVYRKRFEVFKPSEAAPDKYCRVMCYNETHAMLVISQPSFTALAPGYGIRRFNLLDQRIGNFVALHKEPIRDMAFNPVRQDQLLSVSQDKCAKLTNIGSCSEILKYNCDVELWSCCWNRDDPLQFFVGTRRGQILLFDTRDAGPDPKATLEFPVVERRGIIGLSYVPQDNQSAFPHSGLLVQTLGSMWFFEKTGDSYTPHKSSLSSMFWSLRFDPSSRLFLVSTRPSPHSRLVVSELHRMNLSDDPTRPNFAVTSNAILDHNRGGSFAGRSFLRPTIFPRPGNAEQVLIAFSRGSGHSDHKVIVQEVGTDKYLQELPTGKPVLDICPMTINNQHFLAMLGEYDMWLYEWIE